MLELVKLSGRIDIHMNDPKLFFSQIPKQTA